MEVCEECESHFKKAVLFCPICKRKNPLGIKCTKCSSEAYPDSIIGVYKYDGLAKELIHKYKFEDMSSLANFFASKMLGLLNRSDHTGYAITSVPIGFLRRLERGFNQSEKIAKIISKELGIPFMQVLESKNRKAQSQIEDYSQRRENVKGKFVRRCNPPERIILVDDIYTSGATINEATRVLKSSGASSVVAIVIAVAR